MTVLQGSPHTPATAPLATIAVGLGAALGLAWTMFVAAELISDPGGLLGFGLAALIIVPLLALSALAWWQPRWGARVLTALVVLWIGAAAVSVLFASAWQAFEDTHGPVSLILMLVVCVPVAVLGWSRSLLAGVLLLVATATPVLAGLLWWAVGAGLGGTAVLVTVGLPFLAAGVLLVLVGLRDRRAARGG